MQTPVASIETKRRQVCMVMGFASSRCDTLARQVGQEPLNTDAAEFTVIRAITRRQPVKPQKTKKT
jgi:hypothetical protein